MQIGVDGHTDDELLEKYSLGTLREPEIGEFEEHLLLCDSCQDRLEQMDGYVAAMQSASSKLRREQPSDGRERWRILSYPFGWPARVWAPAFAVLFLVLLVGDQWRLANMQPVHVMLEAKRGAEGSAFSKAPAGKHLVLEVDLTQLPNSSVYRMEIVDPAGNPVLESPATAQNGQISLPVATRLSRSLYYVRLYSQSDELLREFGLRVE